MNDKSIVFEMRKRIFEEWRYKRLTWREVKDKYGFSKKWFYKYKKRFLEYGDEGLKDKIRDTSSRPHRISMEQKLNILNYVYANPTHGPLRIANEQMPPLSGKAVWNYLLKESLNTRRKRRIWAHSQGKPVLTEKEIHCISAKNRHIESKEPGELISMDTFWCNIKNLGRIYQYTAADTYSSYGWAKIYPARHSDNSIDFFENHLLKDTPGFEIKRVLTDQGTEFYSSLAKYFDHDFTEYLKRRGIKHTVTKRAHPWTNGYAERLNQTIWEEFYLCRLSKPFYSLKALNEELQKFMLDYNFHRRHMGYKLKEGGHQYPGYAFYGIREFLTAV